MPEAITFDDLVAKPAKDEALNFDDLAPPLGDEQPDSSTLSWLQKQNAPDQPGFFRQLGKSFMEPIKATGRGPGVALGGILKVPDEDLKNHLAMAHERLKGEDEPTTAGKVGGFIGGLAGTLAQAIPIGARAGVPGVMAQFTSAGSYEEFIRAGHRALMEGKDLDEALDIAKKSAGIAGAAQGAAALIMGPAAGSGWLALAKESLRGAAGMGGAQLASNVGEEALGLKTPLTEGVLEATATGGLLPPGIHLGKRVLGATWRGVRRAASPIDFSDLTQSTTGATDAEREQSAEKVGVRREHAPAEQWPIRPVLAVGENRYYGETHVDAIGKARAAGETVPDENESMRGFETAQGDIIDRKQAQKIFEAATGKKIDREEGLHSEDLIEHALSEANKTGTTGTAQSSLEESRVSPAGTKGGVPGSGRMGELLPRWHTEKGALFGRVVRNRNGQAGVAVDDSPLNVTVRLVDGTQTEWRKADVDEEKLLSEHPDLLEAPPPRRRASGREEAPDDWISTVLDQFPKGINAASFAGERPDFPRNKTQLAEAQSSSAPQPRGRVAVLERRLARAKTPEEQSLLQEQLRAARDRAQRSRRPKAKARASLAGSLPKLPGVWERLINYEGTGTDLDQVLQGLQGGGAEGGEALRTAPEHWAGDDLLDALLRDAQVRRGGAERALSGEERAIQRGVEAENARTIERGLDQLREEELRQSLSDNDLGGIGVKLVDDFEGVDADAPFASGAMALPINGAIQIRRSEYNRWLATAKTEAQRKQMVAALVSEEALHVRVLQTVGDEGASAYWKALTGLERWIHERRYRNLGGGHGYEAPLTESQLGHEAIRFRLQQLMRLTPTEIARFSGAERWSMQALTMLEGVVRSLRETLGGKLTQQLLAKVQAGLQVAQRQAQGALPMALSEQQGRNQQIVVNQDDPKADVIAKTTFATKQETAMNYPVHFAIRDKAGNPIGWRVFNAGVPDDVKAAVTKHFQKRSLPMSLPPPPPGRGRQEELFDLGANLPPVKQVQERAGAAGLLAKPTPDTPRPVPEVERLATQHLAESARPNFATFLDELKAAKKSVQPGQVQELWRDQVWNFLEGASASKLEQLRSLLGLRGELGLPRTRFGQPTKEGLGRIAEADEVRTQRGESQELRQKTLGTVLDEARTPERGERAATPEAIEEEEFQSNLRDQPGVLLRRSTIAAIGEKLIREAEKAAGPYERKEIGSAEIRYGSYMELGPDDLLDRETLGQMLTSGAGVNRDTKRMIAGGSVSLKLKAPASSVTRGLVAAVELDAKGEFNRNSPVELLSVYDDHGKAMVFDPAKAGAIKPNVELAKVIGRYRPIARMLADEPVRNFRQRFKTLREFRSEMGNELEGQQGLESEMPTGAMEVPEAERLASEELPEERAARQEMTGEELSGKRPQATRFGGVKGSRQLTADEGGALLDHFYDELGLLEGPQDVLTAVTAAADASNYRLVNAVKKVLRGVMDKEKLEGDDAIARTFKLLYETATDAQSREDFQKRLLTYMGLGMEEGGAGVEAAAGRRGETGRELTALSRRAPTAVEGVVPPEGPGPGPEAPPSVPDPTGELTQRSVSRIKRQAAAKYPDVESGVSASNVAPWEFKALSEAARAREAAARRGGQTGPPERLGGITGLPMALGAPEESEPLPDSRSVFAYYKALAALAQQYQKKGVADKTAFAKAAGQEPNRFTDKAFEDAAAGTIETDPAHLPPITAPEASVLFPNRRKTQVMGAKMGIGSRPGSSAQADAEAVLHQHKLIEEAGLQHVTALGPRGTVEFVPDTFEHDREGHDFINVLRREIPENWDGDANQLPYQLSAMFNSVRAAWEKGDLQAVFGEPIARRLFTMVQSPISHWGLMLQSLQRFGNSIQHIAKDPLVHLRYTWGKMFGGDTYDAFFDRVMSDLTERLGPAAQELLKQNPDLRLLLDKVIKQNEMDQWGRVARRFQSWSEPKRAKKLKAMLDDSEVQAAFEQLRDQALAQGFEAAKKGKTKLTPLEEVMHIVNSNSVEKVGALIHGAVREAERNAARDLFQKENSFSEEDMMPYDERTKDPDAPGPDPTEDQVNRGMENPKYRGWRVLQLQLNYSPVSIDLARRLIKDHFKGTKFKPTPEREAELRIDLDKLSKSPEAEVRRVLDSWHDALQQEMGLSAATPETQMQVRGLIEKEVSEQLEAARNRTRDVVFRDKVKRGVALTPEQKILEQVHANLFDGSDPRMDIPEMVNRVADSSTVKKLLPKMRDLVAKAMQTPFYQQAELRSRFVDDLVNKLGISGEEAARAWDVFDRSFSNKFAEAKEQAAKRALASLTPREQAVIPKNIHQKLIDNINAGNFDGGEVVQEIARRKGLAIPTDKAERIASEMKKLGERLQKLQTLTDAERQEVAKFHEGPGLDQEIARSTADKASLTEPLQRTLQREMGALWSTISRPLNWRSFTSLEGARNLLAASHDLVVANLLLKAGHFVRFPIHLGTQFGVHFSSRGLAEAFERLAPEQGAGLGAVVAGVKAAARDPAAAWESIAKAYEQQWDGLRLGLKPGWVGGRAEALGRGEGRNVDALFDQMNTFGRYQRLIDEYKAKGNWPMVLLTRIFGVPQYALRYIGVVDQWQGNPAVYADILQAAEEVMVKAGWDKVKRAAFQADLIKAAKYDISAAIHETAAVLNAAGETLTPKQIEENAWASIKHRMTEMIRNADLPSDGIEERYEALRRQLAWQEQVKRGLGVIPAKMLSIAGKVIPPVGAFSNAVGHGLNWTLAKLPPGFHLLADLDLLKLMTGKATEPSAFFRTSLDKKQRLIESVAVTIGGSLLAGLIMNRHARYNPFIASAQDRQEMEREGRKPGTIDFHLPDGRVSSWSLIVGPGTVFAPWIAGWGALDNTLRRREKQQAKLNEEAARRGLPAGKIPDMGVGDYIGIMAQAASAAVAGSKTAGGWTTQFVDPNQGFASKRFIASQIQPFVPGLPGWGEISRMMGVSLDKNRATVWDYLVPNPNSGARAVNVLGDPLGTRNGLERVIRVLSGGSYPFPYEPEAQQDQAYAALIESGYHPSAISANQGHVVNGIYRPFTADELERYTVERGKQLQARLAQLGPGATREQAKAAFTEANEAALGSVGAASRRPGRLANSERAPARASRRTKGAKTGPPTRLRRLSRVRGTRLSRFSGRSSRRRATRLARA